MLLYPQVYKKYAGACDVSLTVIGFAVDTTVGPFCDPVDNEIPRVLVPSVVTSFKTVTLKIA